MPWLREGECPPERCQGHCCTHIGIWYLGLDNPTFLKSLQVRGVSVKEMGRDYLVDIPQRCQFLTDKGLCGLYGQPERPDFCEIWPTEPAQLVNDPGCGFRFVWIEEEIPVG